MTQIGITTTGTGQQAEQIAYEYLSEQGLKLLDRNYRGKQGEIDLIMQDTETVIFIEVRYRNNQRHLAAIETIDWRKCERIINTSRQYLQSLQQRDQYQCRFDVILITGDIQHPRIEWIKDAFQA